jgi:hypothetical protein
MPWSCASTGLETVRPAPRPRPSRKSPSVPSAPADDASIPAGGVGGEWTFRGKSKRLTPAGRAELDRRLRAGEGPAAISRAMGINRETVRLAKKKLHQSGAEDSAG